MSEKQQKEEIVPANVFDNPYELQRHTAAAITVINKFKEHLSFNQNQALQLENKIAGLKKQVADLNEKRAKLMSEVNNRLHDTEAELQRMRLELDAKLKEANAVRTKANNELAAAQRERQKARDILEAAQGDRRQAMAVTEAQARKG